jgi:hypothetical protein
MSKALEIALAGYNEIIMNKQTVEHIWDKLRVFGYYEFINGNAVIEIARGRFCIDAVVKAEGKLIYEGDNIKEALQKFKSYCEVRG